MPRSPLRLVVLALAVGAAALAVTGVAVVSTLSGPIGDLIGIGATTRVAAVAIWAIPVILVYRYLPVVAPELGCGAARRPWSSRSGSPS